MRREQRALFVEEPRQNGGLLAIRRAADQPPERFAIARGGVAALCVRRYAQQALGEHARRFDELRIVEQHE